MAARFQNWVTNILGIQSVAQFGAQQSTYNHDPTELGQADCSQYLWPLPRGFEEISLAVIKNNLAVVPDWLGGSVKSPWLHVESADPTLTGCTQRVTSADFIAFSEDFLDLIGKNAKMEKAFAFEGEDAQHVHEAPVYLHQTGELVFADTSVQGWLWALDVTTYSARKIATSPPLQNVNGGTLRDSHLYLTTNGGTSPAIHKCTLPTAAAAKSASASSSTSATETISCEVVVNNYRLNHLNSPNDLIFTRSGHILFTDPTYGWTQGWPGVGPPELPTAIYHFNTESGALVALSNNEVLQPNGLALSGDEKTLYVADSNSTSGKPIGVWEDAVRNVYAFDFDEKALRMDTRRLVHVVERGWPDGLRVLASNTLGREVVLVAGMGGVDVVDVSKGGSGTLLGKWNVGQDVVFNLEPVNKGKTTWMLTGKEGVYKVSITG